MSATDVPASKGGGQEEQPALTGCCEDEIVQLPPGIEIGPVGVDTCSFSWRPQSGRLWAHLEEPLETGCLLQGWNPDTQQVYASSTVSKLGDRVSVKQKIGGGTVGYYPRHRMISIEGRLAALAARDERAPGLLPPSRLDSMAYMCALEVSQLLYPSGIFFEEPSLRRLDLCAELRFAKGEGDRGLRWLKGLAALDLPRVKRDVWSKNGRIETVYYRTPSRGAVRLRIYDKGIESGSDPAGERIRIEQQYRWNGAKSPHPGDIASSDLGTMWQGQLKAWETCDQVVVADLCAARRFLLRAVAEKRVPACTAERLYGQLGMRADGISKEWWIAQGQRHIWGRRSRELRDLGLVLDEDGLPHGEPQETVLPLGLVLRALRQAWPAAAPVSASGG
jgi:hypothetical protein